MKTPDLDELRQHLQLDRHALDEEIESQAALFGQAAEQAVLAMSRRDEAKADMEMAFAKCSDKARQDAAEAGEKITEAGVKEAASMSKSYLLAEKTYRAAKLEAETWDAMRSSFDQRGKMLRELAQLYIAGYFQTRSVGEKDKRQVRAVDTEHRRAVMAAQRRKL